MSIISRMPRPEYDAIEALNITRLKVIERSPLHYRANVPRVSDALTLGIAAHVATLEPERFGADFAIWDRRTESGRQAPRNGKWWDAFALENTDKYILTEAEAREARAIAAAVRSDATASRYLASGDPEVTMTWQCHIEDGRLCKGRIDWLTRIDGDPCVVGLKTARDCRHYAFGSQAAKLGYALQWAWYLDGYIANTGETPRMVEIVVESEPPHAVATYRIEDDILLEGRDNYRELLKVLSDCEASDIWPGPVLGEEVLTLPSWYYPQADTDDVTDLHLE